MAFIQCNFSSTKEWSNLVKMCSEYFFSRKVSIILILLITSFIARIQMVINKRSVVCVQYRLRRISENEQQGFFSNLKIHVLETNFG